MASERLTPERLYSDPPLSAGAPLDLKFSPDGAFITYRRAAADDRERMDLWRIELDTGVHSLWLDARELSQGGDVTRLTAEERAERERRRQFSHGINQYSWHPDGERLLIPSDGQAYLVDLSSGRAVSQALCPANTRQSGFQLSPQGQFLSYVRDGDLYVTDVAGQNERRLTDDASDTVKNGLPDFLAAEEMHRFVGHWWGADESYLLFCKVDEAPVRVSHRLEMEADGAQTIEQRYPYAGESNPRVSLWRYDLDRGEATRIWQDAVDVASPDCYLARVYLDDEQLLIQTQDRLQQSARLLRYDDEAQTWSVLFAEQADSWINLTDDLRLLPGRHVLLTSEASGTRQVIRLEPDGLKVELGGPTHVNEVVGVHEDRVYVTGWDDSPTENHLFAVNLHGGGAKRRITRAPGWHEVAVEVHTGRFVDRCSDISTPPRLDLCNLLSGEQLLELWAERITGEHPYAPYMPLHAYAELGEIPAADGQTLCYRLTPPSEITGRHATVVYVYGGPGPQKARAEWSPLLPQLFAQHGFAVLELDNRGSGNRGRTFEAPIYRQLGTVEVQDQVAGLAALADKPWADLARVGVFGHSYGGYMTLMCLSLAPSHFNAGVAVAPVSDWQLYDTHYTERYMGLPQDNANGYAEANVLSHLDKLRAPLLLMHGMADDNVLFTHTTKIMAELQRLGTPFELMTYPGAKHSMQERDVSIHRFNMILDFFTRRLGGPSSA